ncbi:MAG: cytochrome c3 family protein [Acidobacteriota bacterium]
MKRGKWLIAGAAALVLVALAGGTAYYQAPVGRSCARCHEIEQAYDLWRASTHRSVSCDGCHGGLLTLDAGFHLGNLRRLVSHVGGNVPERIRIRNMDLATVMARCQKCHQQEYANWQSGPHAATYSRIFLDEQHNRKRLLMDDCLRCHGMHFEGSIRELVAPVSTSGPWKLLARELAERPAIPCLACHQVHREGQPLKRPWVKAAVAGAGQEIHRPSLGLFDRRELVPVPVRLLALPAMRDKDRPVKMSPDPRQGLCYQCHAPLAGFQVGSGDDRTAIGVHEGISCLACHDKHAQQTRASCAACHPRLSNCGLDVEKMDTTFRDPKSRHNVHFVKCADCHPKGVPEKRRWRAERAE